MPLGWGIVSAGNHPNSIMAPAINAAKAANLAAVYARDMGRAKEFAGRHGAGAGYDSFEDFLKDPGVDVVYIASPNSLHCGQTVQAARAGKHVLCEKPMALTIKDCQEMVDVCAHEGVKLGIAFQARQHPGTREARRLVGSGALGSVALAHAQWGYGEPGLVKPTVRTGLREWWERPDLVGAGTFMGNGVHGADQLRYVLDSEVTEVTAVTDGQTDAQPLEHLATLLLRFANGTIGILVSGRRLPYNRPDLAVYGSRGRVIASGGQTSWAGSLEVVEEGKERTEGYGRDDGNVYVNLVEDFNRAVEEDGQPEATGLDGLKVVQITLAMVESAKTGKLVKPA